MKNADYFKNKRITIVGLARSGLACANLLYDLGAEVSITDNQDNETTRLNASKLKSKSINLELGKHTQEFIKNRDFIVVSPGVPNNALPIVWAEQFKIPIISEIELAWVLCAGTVIAITGTNGKTTVTTLIGKVLEAAGKNVFICGNISNPFSGEVNKIKVGDFVALEVSSFQLERIQNFKPKIAVILNFSCNHLDRHKDIAEYLGIKKRIFMNQDSSDYLVLNYDDPVVRNFSKETKAQVVYFKEKENLNPNQSGVLAVASILGIDSELCFKVFREFKGIEHRLEFVTKINNVIFINDSKATTADSTIWALKNIPEPIILITGGRHKGIDYKIIRDLAREKVKEAILIGEAAEKIEDALGGSLSIQRAITLKEAVQKAFSKASPGDCVLLSPMCSSFDMFQDFEERGKVFKEAVFNLARSQG
jgi:UDP-N-acetylmuramoylalanine--D-glutamate ligase